MRKDDTNILCSCPSRPVLFFFFSFLVCFRYFHHKVLNAVHPIFLLVRFNNIPLFSFLTPFFPVKIPPRPPRYINFFEPFHFLAGDQLVVPIGASHISLPLQEYNRGSGRKRTNEQNEQYAWVNSSARRELCNTAFPVCICRLTLAWILAKILQRY